MASRLQPWPAPDLFGFSALEKIAKSKRLRIDDATASIGPLVTQICRLEGKIEIFRIQKKKITGLDCHVEYNRIIGDIINMEKRRVWNSNE